MKRTLLETLVKEGSIRREQIEALAQELDFKMYTTVFRRVFDINPAYPSQIRIKTRKDNVEFVAEVNGGEVWLYTNINYLVEEDGILRVPTIGCRVAFLSCFAGGCTTEFFDKAKDRAPGYSMERIYCQFAPTDGEEVRSKMFLRDWADVDLRNPAQALDAMVGYVEKKQFPAGCGPASLGA